VSLIIFITLHSCLLILLPFGFSYSSYTNSHPDLELVKNKDDEGVTKVAKGEELDIKDINNLSEEEEKDKYTSQNC
jgi:hypothetical protein